MLGISERSKLKQVTAIALCLGLAFSLGCTRGEPSKEKKPPRGDEKPKAEKKTPEEKPPAEKPAAVDGREILRRMVDVYQKAESYADKGQVRLDFVIGGKKDGGAAPFSLAFERPNKLRLEAYGAMMVCDGKDFYASIQNAPQQVLRKPAPERLGLTALFSDPMLADAWTQGFGGPMPQVMLLLDKNPMGILLEETEEASVSEPGEIDGRACHRLRIERPEGTATFWIDQKTLVLRRVVMPTDPIRRELGKEGPVESVSLVADFYNAELGGKVDPTAFRFEVPKDAEVGTYFVPAPMRMLGKKVPDLKFVDLDNKPVAVDSLAGKVVVLDFWATWCGPCRETLPIMETVYQRFKNNPKVVFLAVSVDEEKTSNKDLVDAFEKLKVGIPIVRDPKQTAAALQFTGIPTLFLIGPDGVVQLCEIGANLKLAEQLPSKIDELLAGGSIFQKSLREYEKQVEAFAKEMEAQIQSQGETPSDNRKVEEHPLPQVKTAPRSDPARLKLAPLWKCPEVKSPGNITVVRDGAGPARLLVVEEWNSVAEVGLDGKPIALHKFDLGDGERIGSLRTAVGRDGRRYYVAYLLSMQRCHVYDEKWKLVAHYPEDALSSPHSGITDVQLADLDGDGKLNLYVSYWGVVGVQGASLEGNRLWANRSLSEVACLAVGEPDADGRRELYCAGGSGAIVALDSKGERRGEIAVRNRLMQWIASADLRGDGRLLWCGMAEPKIGGNAAVGFSLAGDELWSYALPEGIPSQPIDPIVPGRVTRDGPGQWILPGVDGSIHIISADGTLLDKFNYGAELHGLATAEVGGRPALIVATAAGVEAWEVK